MPDRSSSAPTGHNSQSTAHATGAGVIVIALAGMLFWSNAALAQSSITSAAIEKAAVQAPPSAPPIPELAPPAPAQAIAHPPSIAPKPTPASCADLSEQATSADLKASTAQSQRRPAEELARLYDGVIDRWTRAAQTCTGRAQDRARRNLAENHRIRSTLAGMQGAEGAACNTATNDATALQELARQAFGERRWPDAAGLYRKAEDGWDMAAERCTGNQQQTAIARRDQAMTDAHNAEHCAPTFELARTVTQRFRSESPGLATAERARGSQQAETLWRHATDQCKGQAQELARNNAKALERERGTPWASTPMPAQESQTPPPRSARTGGVASGVATAAGAVAVAGVAPASTLTRSAIPVGAALLAPAAATASTGIATAIPAQANRTADAAAATVATVAPAPAQAPAEAPVKPNTMEELDILAGGTRFKGLFLRDQRTGVLTGRGRITWANGDSYDGDIAQSRRQGKGIFIWANGQSFDGEWLNDQPSGVASVRFANGNRYQGATVNGMPEGKGLMQYASGDRYDGQLKAGVPHGEGSYRWANGQEYQGQWVTDLPQGKGRMKFTNGDVYEGTVEQGLATGSGPMEYASGDRYEGHVIKGTPNGKGTYLWKNGDRYEGDWKHGKKDGQGVFTWKNGDRWEGEFDEDDRVGKGTMTQAK